MNDHDYDDSQSTLDMLPPQGYCRRCGRYTDDSQPCVEAAEPSAPLREATEAEDQLIQSLSVSVGHRLLRDWQDLPDEARALPMNRAFLAALGHAMGKFLGATAINDPANVEGWNVLVEQSLEIVRRTAQTAREIALAQRDRRVTGPDARALVPEPKSIM